MTNFLLIMLTTTADHGSSTFNTKFEAAYSEVAPKEMSGGNKANLALLVGVTIYHPANAFQYTPHTWSAIHLSYAKSIHLFRKLNVVPNSKSPEVKILCVLYLHYNLALTFE